MQIRFNIWRWLCLVTVLVSSPHVYATPEIQVFDGSTNILANGRVDLGTTPLGVPVIKNFIIFNAGTSDLTITNTSVTGTGFSIGRTGSGGVIQPQASNNLAMQFNAASAGEFTGSITLANNDSDENPFVLNLSVTVVATANLTVTDDEEIRLNSQEVVSFGNSVTGIPVIKTFTLTNSGDGILALGELILPSGFSNPEGFPTTVSPDTQTAFKVQLDAETEGQFSGALRFTTNMGEMSEVVLVLTGEIVDKASGAIPSGDLPTTPVTGDVQGATDNSSQVSGDLTIGSNSSIIGGELCGNISNAGLLANLTLCETATVTGGKVAGEIINEGELCDFTMMANGTATGGQYCGNILNNGILQDPTLTADAILNGDGRLAGGVVNEGTICDMTLASETRVVGGKLSCAITGNVEEPAIIGDAQITADSELDNVCLTHTVQVSTQADLGANVIVRQPTSTPVKEDYCISAAEVAEFNASKTRGTEAAAFDTFDQLDILEMPTEAFSGLRDEQLSALNKEALTTLTVEQFSTIPTATLAGFTGENLSGLPSAVYASVDAARLQAMSDTALQQNPEAARLLTNLTPELAEVAAARGALPEGWEIDAETGWLTLTAGSLLGFKSKDLPEDYPTEAFELPDLPDGDSCLAVAGSCESTELIPLLDLVQTGLDDSGLSELKLNQTAEGIIQATGEGELAGINYAFIPRTSTMTQQTKTGAGTVSVDAATNSIVVATPTGYNIPMIPAPKDLASLSGVITRGRLGRDGDTLLSYTVTVPDSETTSEAGDAEPRRVRRDIQVHQVVMFDPFIEQAPPNAPLGVFNDRVVFPDGTAQRIHPTVKFPQGFINEGLKFPGVEGIVLQTDGSFRVAFEGGILRLARIGEVSVRPLPRFTREPTRIVLNTNGTLTYSVQDREEVFEFVLAIQVVQ